MNLLAEALDLAADGWPVLPLCDVDDRQKIMRPGKVPLTRHGVDDATTDQQTIRSWWQRWPFANIGAKVPDSVVIFDVDPRNGGDAAALGNLPPTLTAWSGRGDGGRHHYFKRPLFELSSAKVPAGIDLKRSGYVVVPPSVHPATGEPYRWEHDTILPCPLHLLQMIRHVPRPPLLPEHRTGDGSHLVRWLAGPQFAQNGINDALYWAARRAAEDGVLDGIETNLIDVAVSVGESERQARATVASARRKAVGA